MLATSYKFSPRTIEGIFSRSFRSKKSGYSLLVLPKVEPSSKMAVVLTSATAKTSIRRHAIKRQIYQHLEQWVKSGALDVLATKGHTFYLLVLVTNWIYAEKQLRSQDWTETVEYLLSGTKQSATSAHHQS